MSEKVFYCFDEYRLDVQTHVLYRGENVVRLEPKIVDLLLYLIQRQGSVVSKDELMKAIWAGSIVEESAIRRNISLMRSVLDSTNTDRYIETLPRQGYRFKPVVTQQIVGDTALDRSQSDGSKTSTWEVSGNNSGLQSSEATTGTGATSTVSARRVRWYVWLNACLVVLVAATLVYRYVVYPRLHRPIISSRQLTTNSEDLPIMEGTISPDGSMIAFADETTLYVGDARSVERHALSMQDGIVPQNVEWFSDSIHLLLSAVNAVTQEISVWRVPVLGGKPELIIRNARLAAPSTDGTSVVFVRDDNQLWIANSDGSDAHVLMTAPNKCSFGDRPQFSPDDKYVLYSLITHASTNSRIEAREIATGTVTVLFESSHFIPDFRLIDDNELLLSQQLGRGNNMSQLVSVAIHLSTGVHSLSSVLAKANDGIYTSINATHDGRTLFAIVGRYFSTVQLASLNKGGHEVENVRRLTLNDSHNLPSAWMPDSKSVVFFSNRTGHYGVYQQGINSTEAQALVSDEHDYFRPVVSADTKWLFYFMPEDVNLLAGNLKVSLFRHALPGRVGQLVDERADFFRAMRCSSRANRCVLVEHDGTVAVFYEFEPEHGKSRELARVNWTPAATSFYWDLSPDGTRIAYLDTTTGPNDIAILDIDTIPVARAAIHSKGFDPFASLYWDANAAGFYVSAYNSHGDLLKLLHVHMDGTADVLRQQVSTSLSWAIPSPDGNYLMFQKFARRSNIWLMER